MASGHVNRIKRPNTWLHRPMLQNVKKALANPEPSTHGTFETCRRIPRMSVYRLPAKTGSDPRLSKTAFGNFSELCASVKSTRNRVFLNQKERWYRNRLVVERNYK